jgi:hypothetical protein
MEEGGGEVGGGGSDGGGEGGSGRGPGGVWEYVGGGPTPFVPRRPNNATDAKVGRFVMLHFRSKAITII